MASEYVSFMLVFGLGISMVVAITITMQTLSNGVSDTSAKVALDNVLEEVKGSISDGINSELQWNGISPSYQHNLDLSRLLVNKFPYKLYITSISGSYYLVGETINSQTHITENTPLLFTIKDVSISGTITSTSSNPYILFEKVSNSIIIILGNS